MIAEAAGKEEVLALEAVAAETTAAAKPTEPKPAAPKREIKPFEYSSNRKGISVPGFKWKAGEGNEKLVAYSDGLKKLSTKSKSV